MEIMIATGILAVGMVSVASIFPAAIHLQQQTFEDLNSRQLLNQCRAMIRSRPFNGDPNDPNSLVTALNADPNDAWDTEQRVFRLPPGAQPTEAWLPRDGFWELPGAWTPRDRSYGAGADLSKRRLYWVPLLRDTDPASGSGAQDWEVHVVVVAADLDANYDRGVGTPENRPWANYWDGYDDAAGEWRVPGVRSIDIDDFDTTGRFDFDNDANGNNVVDQIGVGDILIDSNGRSYQVKLADEDGVDVNGTISVTPVEPTQIWYSPPAVEGRSGGIVRVAAPLLVGPEGVTSP